MWPEVVLSRIPSIKYFAICSIGLISSVHFIASLKLILPEQPNSVLFHTDYWERCLRGCVPTTDAGHPPIPSQPPAWSKPLRHPTWPFSLPRGSRSAERSSKPVQFYIFEAPTSDFSNTVQPGRQKKSSLSSSKKAGPTSAVWGFFFFVTKTAQIKF